MQCFHREASVFTEVINPPLVEAPWTNYINTQRHYVFIGLMTPQPESVDWLPDPSFQELPLTLPDLWIQQGTDGRCPGATWVCLPQHIVCQLYGYIYQLYGVYIPTIYCLVLAQFSILTARNEKVISCCLD